MEALKSEPKQGIRAIEVHIKSFLRMKDANFGIKSNSWGQWKEEVVQKKAREGKFRGLLSPSLLFTKIVNEKLTTNTTADALFKLACNARRACAWNKLEKLRRHASQVHFAIIHFG